MKKLTNILLLYLCLLSSASIAVDLSICPGQVGGDWNYGRAPTACNASPFGDDRVVYGNYPGLIFRDQQNRILERNRYTEEMHSLLVEAARYYIKKRKPTVGTEEINQWILAVVVTAAQESRMSHYRVAMDNHLKMLRGDSLHGHGIMQLDDRSHFNAIEKGVAWNLITNVTYGMDILFSEWERAPSQSCVGRPTNYVARIRAAWAAYNGGSGSICRWTNPNSSWAANDLGFFAIYQSHSWSTYVRDENKAASVNVACLIENKSNCPPSSVVPAPMPAPAPQPVPQPGPGAASPIAKQLYKTSAAKYCIFTGPGFDCVDQFRDAMCLTTLASGLSLTPQSIDDVILSQFTQTDRDRHILCGQFDHTLLAVGAQATIRKALNLRSTPGGGRIATVPASEVIEIVDFEMRNFPVNERYYKIHSQEGDGFVFGGTAQNHSDWLTPAVRSTPQRLVQKGDRVRVVNSIGINLRSDQDNRVLMIIPSGSELLVEEVTVTGSSNLIFYRVNFGGHSGHIYGGELMPQETTSLWAVRMSN